MNEHSDRLDAIFADETPLGRARLALFSIGSQDMPVGSDEVLEAMDAFERAVRDDQIRREIRQARDLINVIQGLNERISGLEDDARRLRALENHGVDNWDGYSDAVRGLRDE